jgi:hypothetical protein
MHFSNRDSALERIKTKVQWLKHTTPATTKWQNIKRTFKIHKAIFQTKSKIKIF